MAGKYTEAQKKASLKYQSTMSQVKITVPREVADGWRQYCQEQGITMTDLITEAVTERIQSE